jgi:hypothetical protein
MDYTEHFSEVSPKQPSMMLDFQGGALNPWDGPAEGCEAKTDESFVNFYYRDNAAQRVTILGLSMIHGGTNWGWIGAPFVPTSYRYSAAIAENRTIGSKYYEIESLALFTRVAKDLTKTNIVGNSTSYSDNEAITTIELRNPDTDAVSMPSDIQIPPAIMGSLCGYRFRPQREALQCQQFLKITR